MSPVDLFWKKVIKTDSCWIWKGCKNNKGYGQVRVKGKSYYAHRFSYLLENPNFDNTLYVLHKCDTPLCVNPSHLWLGTQSENIRDMINKGRNSPPPTFRGHKNNNSKLSEENVINIRTLFSSGNYTKSKLAKIHGVTREAIHLILIRKNWAWL